jgi:hypothetical protein
VKIAALCRCHPGRRPDSVHQIPFLSNHGEHAVMIIVLHSFRFNAYTHTSFVSKYCRLLLLFFMQSICSAETWPVI